MATEGCVPPVLQSEAEASRRPLAAPRKRFASMATATRRMRLLGQLESTGGRVWTAPAKLDRSDGPVWRDWPAIGDGSGSWPAMPGNAPPPAPARHTSNHVSWTDAAVKFFLADSGTLEPSSTPFLLLRFPPSSRWLVRNPRPRMQTLAILIPLIVVSTVLLLLLFFTTALLLHRRRRGIELADEGGPTNLEREDRIDGEGGLDGVEARWLQTVDEPVKMGYVRAKSASCRSSPRSRHDHDSLTHPTAFAVWQTQYPPDSQPTEITLSQFLSIQEKGVSAWSFEPDYESNPAIIVESRTEITFLADGQGMAPEEGGGCSVQSNLPVPKLNDVYYFECKMYEKPSATNVSIGLATKPYPSFRMPGTRRLALLLCGTTFLLTRRGLVLRQA